MRKFFAVAAVFISTQLSAQHDSTATLDNVVVTATRFPLKQSQTGKLVTVLDHNIISNNIGRSLSELLNTQAGVYINGASNNLGTDQDLYFRGAGTGNMLVVIDGIPVYDPSQISNSFDLNSIPLDQIERVEILKGGQSTLWGSDAVAGVIQIFLKKPAKKKIAANALLSYGSFKTIHANAGLNGGLGKLNYKVDYSYLKSNGFSSAYDSTGTKNFDKDGYKQNNLMGELRYQLTKTFSARAFGNLNVYNSSLDAGAFTDDKDYSAKNKNKLGGLAFKYMGQKFAWNLLGSFQKVDRGFLNDSIDITNAFSKYVKSSAIGRTVMVEIFGNSTISKHVAIVGGVQYMNQNSEQSYFSTGSLGPYKSTLGSDSTKTNQLSAYGSLLVSNVGKFNFELGSRINRHSIYGYKATYTINPSYIFSENTKLFLNISSGYKTPSLFQLYSSYGNKGLQPEISVTYELGFQTQTNDKKISLRFAGFKRDIKNLIIFYTTPSTYNSQYMNRDEQHDYGFEVESSILMGNIGVWSSNLSFVDGEGKENGAAIKNLYRRPKLDFNSMLTFRLLKSLLIVPALRYVGSRLKGLYDIGPGKQPPYYTIGLFTAYDLKKIRLFIDLQNITNQKYFDIVGYNSKRFNLSAGVTINL